MRPARNGRVRRCAFTDRAPPVRAAHVVRACCEAIHDRSRDQREPLTRVLDAITRVVGRVTSRG